MIGMQGFAPLHDEDVRIGVGATIERTVGREDFQAMREPERLICLPCAPSSPILASRVIPQLAPGIGRQRAMTPLLFHAALDREGVSDGR